jgi:ABC-type phosphate transport system substrate-binding protein
MRTMRRLLSLTALGWAILGAPAGTAQQAREFRVIVHPDNPTEHLEDKELSRLFLKQSTRWEDGTPVLPVDQPTEARVRESFSRAVFGRSTSAMVAHWQQQIFSGRGVPPTELENERAVIEYVAGRPGAVAYVSTGTPIAGVKVVEVTP